MWLRRFQKFAFFPRQFATFYSKEHEWIHCDGHSKSGTVGISDHAQSLLGDVIHIDLPELNSNFTKGAIIGSVESVKTVSDLYAPVSGSVLAVNNELESQPELMNSSPEDKGWFAKVSIDNTGELEQLMSKEQYLEFLETLD